MRSRFVAQCSTALCSLINCHSPLLPFRAFCVEGPQNLMFVRPCVRPCLSIPLIHPTYKSDVEDPTSILLEIRSSSKEDVEDRSYFWYQIHM